MFDYIEIYADRHKQCGSFWLTGSQTFHMMKNVTESLAGRAGIIRMLGLSNSEIEKTYFDAFEIDPKLLLERLNNTKQMTLPEVYQRIMEQEFFR